MINKIFIKYHFRFAILIIPTLFFISKRTQSQSFDDSVYFDKIQLGQQQSETSAVSARNYFNQALNIARNLGDSNKVAIALNNLGKLELVSNNSRLSTGYFEDALEIVDSLKYPGVLADIQNNLAKNYKQNQQYTKALALYQRSYLIRQNMSDTLEQIGSMINIGSLYSAINNYPMALKYLLPAKELLKDHNDKLHTASLFNTIAIVYKRMGDFSNGIYYYQLALSDFVKLGKVNSQAYILGNMGALYEEINQLDTAISFYNRALKLHQIQGDEYGIGMMKINKGLALVKKQDYQQAKLMFNESLEIANNLKSSQLLIYTYDGFTNVYEGIGDYKSAFKYFKLTKSLQDSVFDKQKQQQIAELETKYETEKKDREIENLQKDNEIKSLTIEEQIQRVKAQRMSILLLLSGAFLVTVFIVFYLRWVKTRNLLQKNSLELKNLQTEQKMLRSQMNPHFIYNSLNSIQSFISSSQNYEAERYLARFAKLMRGILENSRQEYVPFEKEIEILQLYIELEQLRFDHTFSFEFVIDDSIDTEFIGIPPMLIQPFIENAVKHGIKGVQNGEIKIEFKMKDDLLICTIVDNGIGRKASQVNKPITEHRSLGLEITRERLATLEKQSMMKAGFSIIDLYDEQNKEALGTKVEVVMPFCEM